MTIRDIVVAFGFDVDRNSEREAQGSIKGIANLAKSVLGAIGIGFSIAGLSSLAEAAADVEALDSQFSQVFSGMEEEAESRLKAIEDDTDVLVNRMKGSFSRIAAFAKVSGVEQADALELADRAMIAVADSSAYYDRSIEQVTESLQSFLKGNYENDAALGLSATETTRNAAANDLYGKSFKDLSEAEKQFTLLKMVEDANAASGALGQAARESDTWTNQLGNLKQELKDLKAAAGVGILKPAVAVLKLLISLTQRAKNAIAEMTGENGIMTRSFERLHALVKRLKPAIDRMMQGLALGASRGTAFIKGVVDRLGGMGNVLKILTMTAAAFFAVMAFAKAVSGVKKLYAAFKAVDKVLLAAKLKVLTAVWETLKLLFSMGLSAISALWKTVWGGISAFFRGIWDGIVSFLAGVFDSIRTGISERMERVRSAIMDGFQAAIDFIKGLPAQAVQWGADFIGGLIKGITSKMGAIGEAVKGVGGKIKSFLHFSVPDEGPLTDYESWMPDFMSGLAQGIRANEHLVLDQVQGLVDGISVLMQAATAQPATAAGSMVSNMSSNVTQNVNISNSYSGGSQEVQRNVSKAMKKSASDATTYMARGLAYARG